MFKAIFTKTKGEKKQMKVAVISADIGGIDPVFGMCKQTIECDYFYYCDNNLPYPLPNLNNRLKSKYLKAQTHRFLPDYDAYIWVDARIRIAGGNFAQVFMEQLEGHELVVYKHRERKNVYEEMEYIIDQMSKGNQYLLSRYGNQQMVKELLFYAENGMPKDYPLFTGGFFARLNNDHVNKCFDEWWRRILEFSYFDQTMLSFVTWQQKLNVNFIQYDDARTHKLFKVESHL
jgi:hypothetical protein